MPSGAGQPDAGGQHRGYLDPRGEGPFFLFFSFSFVVQDPRVNVASTPSFFSIFTVTLTNSAIKGSFQNFEDFFYLTVPLHLAVFQGCLQECNRQRWIDVLQLLQKQER